jgi:hypothetical protein
MSPRGLNKERAWLAREQSVSEQPVRIVVCAVLPRLIELEDEENLTKKKKKEVDNGVVSYHLLPLSLVFV